MLKLNSVPGNSSEIQGWSTWCWKDSQKVQGPVTCEKVQSGEEAIMLLISCKAIFLPRKSKLSVTEMLEEMKPYIWDKIGCNKVWKWCMFKNKELLMREKIFVGRFTRAQERKIFWPAFYFSIRYSHTHFTQATNVSSLRASQIPSTQHITLTKCLEGHKSPGIIMFWRELRAGPQISDIRFHSDSHLLLALTGALVVMMLQ